MGYSQLSNLGVEALAGFFSAYIGPRLAAPLVTAVGLAATIGAGATAQLGAMRINEEIDALEVMGIRAIAYLVSTRVLAGLVVAIPLCCVSLVATFLSTKFLVGSTYHQSTGVYDHYFNTFLRPTDLVWSLVQCMSCKARHHAGAHLLRFQRLRRPRWRWRGDGSCGADLTGRGDDRDHCGGTGRLRAWPAISTCRDSDDETKATRIRPAPVLWTLIFVVLMVVGSVLVMLAFNRDLQPYAPVTLVSDRAGLVMEPGSQGQIARRGSRSGRLD